MAVYNRKDRYYKKAKDEGWRSRAAYKLMEIHQRFKIFKQGMQVVDLGCFPGSWMQIAIREIGPSGRIIGIDLEEVLPFSQRNAVCLQGDLYVESSRRRLIAELARKADLVLSDMSPNLSGIKFKDHYNSYELAELGLQMCFQVLKEGGDFVTKIFPGNELEIFKQHMKESFQQLKIFIPDATRKTSTEVYLVGKGFQAKSENTAHK
jgi:23S rRNA (uridine2552-2'-O)-methyltransferase